MKENRGGKRERQKERETERPRVKKMDGGTKYKSYFWKTIS